jgi:hypothetical protein
MADEPIQEHERRAENVSMMNMVMRVHDTVSEIDKKIDKHIKADAEDLANNIKKLMSDAFPEGDAGGHRRVHEADIRRVEDRALFWRKMKFAISQWGLLGFLGWAGYYLWKALLRGPQ